MYILHKYLIQQITKHFCIIMAMVIGIYTIVDFFERIDNFMEAGAPLSAAVQFLLFKIPFIIAQILPVGILLSILITLGLMSKKNEFNLDLIIDRYFELNQKILLELEKQIEECLKPKEDE